ncbi:MATE family efflux transporter, partial [bacterium]|nr:MATE family efflux transporter [bacterium]
MQLDLTRGNIRDHMKTLAIPATVGFLFHTLYNVTDTFFAGQISTQALAALSLSFPVFFMVIAVAAGMSEALTALVGNALGEN